MVEDAFIIPPLLLLLLRAKGTTLRSGSRFGVSSCVSGNESKKRFVKLLFCGGKEAFIIPLLLLLLRAKGTTLRSGSRFGVSSCVSGNESKKRFVKLLFCGGKEEEVFYLWCACVPRA